MTTEVDTIRARDARERGTAPAYFHQKVTDSFGRTWGMRTTDKGRVHFTLVPDE